MSIIRWLIIIVVVVTPLVAFSQTFTKIISSSLDDIPYAAFELPDGDYLVCIARGEYDPFLSNYYYSDIMYKLDNQGNIIDSTIMDESGSYYLFGLHLLSYQQNLFFWSQIIDKSDIGHRGLLYGFLSEDLEVTKEAIIFNADTGWAFYDCIINSSDNLVFIGTEGVYETGSYYNVVLEFNPRIGIVRKGIIGTNYYNKIVEVPAIQGYHLGGYDSICQMNYDLKYEGVVFAKPLADTLFLYQAMESLSDSTYARSAVGFEFTPQSMYDFGFAVFNQYGQRISLATFGKPDTTDYSYRLDHRSPDSIFIGGTSNYYYNFAEVDSWFAVYNLTQYGDINWNLYFGHSGLHILSYVLTTSDGGSLITGTYWDWRNNPNQERDAVIVKVNNEGLLVNTDEGDVSMLTQFLVYPNPGSDKLYLECGLSDGIVEVFDSYGRKVITKNFSSGYLALSTSGLAEGLYYYRIISGGKAYYGGKWIKE